VSASRLLRSARLGWALSSGSDLVLSAVANSVFEDFGLLLDRAEAVLDGVVGGAEVSCDVANIDRYDVISQACVRDLE
jgi:hypothetical protein